ncbi:SDR family NAD(P)-dependent oxidoreductase [Nonomuraea aurantiaca]|uniref:SDR family NAD(P)-dependent oxidoreductase n=1 Tax=Nonomuraea aurantiaca TaxID=2878562 RepID=UPI001CD998A0|nr:SDR family NAD(P)-dependent oxidoreductase [Nonomuraea aurantiaca]MCA2229580.1 SDR family NAD(P)-dependent oxidoreductase [Nonomuraea aurantiaca]
MGRFDGLVAVVTGGGSGIGLATAERFHQEGARVAIAGRDRQRLRQAAASIGGDVLAVTADVSRLDEIDLLLSTVTRELGQIDVLFVNAGFKGFQALQEATESFFDTAFDVNAKGAFFTLQKAVPHLNDGAAVVLCGLAPVDPAWRRPGTSVYTASKAALRSFARSAAAELAPRLRRPYRATDLTNYRISHCGISVHRVGIRSGEIVLAAAADRIGKDGVPAIDPVLVPLASLTPAPHYPRLNGVDQDHVRVLAESPMPMPPIVVRRSMEVIDGMHRICAARSRGESYISAFVLDESDTEAYIQSVTANITHGLPLSLRDRKAAAERLLRLCPGKSDRAIAQLAGLSGKTVGALRRTLDDLPQAEARVGQDGRVRPVDSTEHRRQAERLITEHPGASLREIAGLTGLSVSTVSVVRRHMRSGDSPVSTVERLRPRPEPAHRTEADPRQTLSLLMRDPSLRYTDVGRTLLQWLHRHPLVDGPPFPNLISEIPLHCLPAVARLARRYAAEWEEFAQQAEDMMISDVG